MMFFSVLLILLLIAADQFTKLLVLAYLKPGNTVDVIDGLLKLVYVENRGAAFGMLQNRRIFFVVLTVVACAVLLYLLFFYKSHDFFSKMACILIVAGGVGNLIDRIKLAYVVDFISVSFFPPVFNLADCCVTVGVAAAVLHLILSEIKNARKKREAAEEGAESAPASAEEEKENHESDNSDTGSGE